MITKELCELAVMNNRTNGNALRYVPKEMRTKELCELAVMSDSANGHSLSYVPKEMITIRIM
jgi:hypothetical protein